MNDTGLLQLTTDKLSAMFVEYVLVTATVLLLVLLGLNWLLSRSSPATRHATWLLGVFGVAVIPLLPYVAWGLGLPFEAGRWHLPLLPAAAVFDTRLGASSEIAGTGVRVLVLLTGIWVAGAAVMLAGLARSIATIMRLTRQATSVVPGRGTYTRLEAAVTAASACAPNVARVALSGDIATPLAWGLIRPVILLPSAAVDWPLQRATAVLRHEFAHIRRRDWAGAILLELVRSILWPNPLAWVVARLARMEQEQACDDAVLRSGTVPVDYARCLLEVASSSSLAPVPRASLALARQSNLRYRVRRILDRSSDRRPASRFAIAAAFLLVAAVSPALATLDPWHCDQEASPAVAYSVLAPTHVGAPVHLSADAAGTESL
jgi:beta-lactamase regulating signal transducer with metallopeptidase domain